MCVCVCVCDIPNGINRNDNEWHNGGIRFRHIGARKKMKKKKEMKMKMKKKIGKMF